MSLTLYYHPLSSFCQKVLIALYESGVAFTPKITNLGDVDERAALLKLWPIGKFPLLRDEAQSENVPEATIIIEYLAAHFPQAATLIPADAVAAHRTRLADRFYDLYVNEMMQKIVGDRLRPTGSKDPHGVEHARGRLKTALDMIDGEMGDKQWATGDNFTMADCAAAPALFYADLVQPYRATHKNAAAYYDRLQARPSYARVLKEAEPYFHMFPKE